MPLDNVFQGGVLRCEAWKALDWLIHGFSQRNGGSSTVYGPHELNLGFTPEDDEGIVLKNRQWLVERLLGDKNSPGAELITLRQIHSAIVYRLDDGRPLEPGDGMMTDRAGKLLAILTADCVPVLVVDQRKRVVASFHAGWRGTVQGIVQTGVAQMQSEFGSRAEDLSAAIGPCIRACCYKVGADVHGKFCGRFQYASELFVRDSAENLRLDLVKANQRQLIDAGLSKANIHELGQCTSCHPEQFFSYRQSGGRTGRMMNVIGIRRVV